MVGILLSRRDPSSSELPQDDGVVPMGPACSPTGGQACWQIDPPLEWQFAYTRGSFVIRISQDDGREQPRHSDPPKATQLLAGKNPLGMATCQSRRDPSLPEGDQDDGGG